VRELEEETAEGVIRKFVQRLPGGAAGTDVAHEIPHYDIESVVIPMIGRRGVKSHTLCVSSRSAAPWGAGSARRRRWGWSVRSRRRRSWGSGGRRRTSAGEGQEHRLHGMGEPLDNVEAVIDAIAVLTDHNGPAIPMANIMVSTVGKIDGLRRLCEQMERPGWRKLGIAVSINAPNDEIRSRIMPINRATPMAELRGRWRPSRTWGRTGRSASGTCSSPA